MPPDPVAELRAELRSEIREIRDDLRALSGEVGGMKIELSNQRLSAQALTQNIRDAGALLDEIGSKIGRLERQIANNQLMLDLINKLGGGIGAVLIALIVGGVGWLVARVVEGSPK